jgi:hypothetical protein
LPVYRMLTPSERDFLRRDKKESLKLIMARKTA